LPNRQVTHHFRDLSRGTYELYSIRGHLSTPKATLLPVEAYFLHM